MRRIVGADANYALPPRAPAVMFSQLPAEFAVERIRSAAAQRDGEEDQSPKENIFPAAARQAVAIAVGKQNDTDDHRHFDRDRSCEKTREQTQDNANRADGFLDVDDIGDEQSRFDAAFRYRLLGKGRDRRTRQLGDAVDQQSSTDRRANERIRKVP